jgi:excisionase family DNA binding protein
MANMILSGIELPELYEGVRQIIRDEISNIRGEPKPEKEEFIDINEACNVVKKAKQTIYQYCNSGKIPHFKSGGKNYFKRSELLDWIESGNRRMR